MSSVYDNYGPNLLAELRRQESGIAVWYSLSFTLVESIEYEGIDLIPKMWNIKSVRALYHLIMLRP